MRAPPFWYRRAGVAAAVLEPFADIYGMAARLRRSAGRPVRAGCPVICVGNLTVGGTGKTPIALSVAKMLRKHGQEVHFLSRGYGGRLRGPVRVDADLHTAREVGDEPLLLAASGPTWVAADRAAGAKAATEAGATAIVMDDGFQNPGLHKDLSLIVVDGAVGFGNGRLLPAGPLREPIAEGLARADAVVVMGEDDANIAKTVARRVPILKARLVPSLAARGLVGRRVLAFAGIGRPEKFFRTCEEMGLELVGRIAFGDHRRYTPDDIMKLVEAASARDAVPVTTVKDYMRLPPEARAMVETIPVTVAWSDEKPLRDLLNRSFGNG